MNGLRRRLANGDIEFYEDNIARMLHIIDEVKAISVSIDDPDVLEAVYRRLAAIVEQAGETRRSMIDHRDDRQLNGNGENEH